MNNPLAWLAQAFSMTATLFGIRNRMQPSYRLLSQHGNIEIRAYPPLLLAETSVAADYRQAGSIGFQRLAGYIFGANSNRERIAMTTPVFKQLEGRQWKMSFVMPAAYRLDNLPSPSDREISLQPMAARKVAVLRYSGNLDEQSLAEHTQQLLAWLAAQALQPLSQPRSAAYDPPWTIPNLRRNEIHVDIA